MDKIIRTFGFYELKSGEILDFRRHQPAALAMIRTTKPLSVRSQDWRGSSSVRKLSVPFLENCCTL
ncbi:MAG: hypothetical protein ACFB12_20035 [Leptolyngbyaceae cyanobacterium]